MSGDLHPLFETPLPEGWKLSFVDDIKAPEKSSCVAGPFGSNISSKYFVESGVPVIRGGNLRDDLTRFVPEGFVYVSDDRATKYKAQHVRGGDLVFTCWGTIGQVGLIPNDGPFPEYIISNKQLKLRPNFDIADPVYLFFYFAGPKMVQHILGKAIGAAVPGINLGILKALPVVLPPLPIQKRIASILSAYDELIENNQRRIKILETMARNLYREWFVHFRFPGHEKVRRVSSPLGEIPEGWEVNSGSKILKRLTVGAVYRAGGVSQEGSVRVIGQSTDQELGFHENKPDHLASTQKPIAVFGDHTCKMELIFEPFSVGPNVVPFEAADGFPTTYVYYTVNRLIQTQEYKRHWIPLNAKEVVVADIDRAARFSALVQPLLLAQQRLKTTIRVLVRTRNLLMPKLLSGKLIVTEE